MNLSIIKKSYPDCRILGVSEYYINKWNKMEITDISIIDELIDHPNVKFIQFKINDNGVIKYPDFAIEELRNKEIDNKWTKEDEERDILEIAEVLGDDFRR